MHFESKLCLSGLLALCSSSSHACLHLSYWNIRGLPGARPAQPFSVRCEPRCSMLEYPQNAQDFIRALKAASDPPHVGGPFKIQIARKAWDDIQLYVPNKAEAIADWLLSRLLKDKSGTQYDILLLFAD